MWLLLYWTNEGLNLKIKKNWKKREAILSVRRHLLSLCLPLSLCHRPAQQAQNHDSRRSPRVPLSNNCKYFSLRDQRTKHFYCSEQ